jgi:hypothetical protein
MTQRILGLVMVLALFGGAILADDGNMGGGGYTGCDGDNPPPTCCDTSGNTGQTCDQGGFASTQTIDPAVTQSVYTATVVDTMTDSLGLIY